MRKEKAVLAAVALVAVMAGCSGSEPGGASASAGSGAGGATGSGGSSGGSGGSSAGASAGGAASGGSGGAQGGSGGSGGSPASACGVAAARRTATKAVVSDKVIDYTLEGAPGAQHVNVLILMFDASIMGPDTPAGPGYLDWYTPEQLGDAFFSNPDGVQAYLNEASYGKVTLSGRVVGWLDQDPASVTEAFAFQENRDIYAEQGTPYATLADYDVIYIAGITDTGDQHQLGWGLQNSLSTSQGLWQGGVDWMINSFFFTEAGQAYPYSTILPSRSWAHELLHTLAISGHDVSLDCGTQILADACAVNGYGNVFSAMGESAIANHPTIGMKDALGWLEPGQLQTVTASGEVTLCPTATVDDGIKGLVIPLKTPITLTSTTVNEPTTFDRIFVERRAAIGFDGYLSRLTDPDWQARFLTTPRDIRGDGVVISLGYAAETDSSALLDMHPTLTDYTNDGIVTPGNAGKFLDAMLNVGETFELPDQGIAITVTALEGEGIRVDVTY